MLHSDKAYKFTDISNLMDKSDRKSPKVTKIIKIDFLASISFIFPIIVFLMALFIEIFGFFPDLKHGRESLDSTAIPFFIKFGIIALVIGVAIIFWRVYRIKKLFNNGSEVHGTVDSIGFERGRGRINYSYKYKDKFYFSWSAIMKAKETKHLKTGDKINILVNPSKPNNSIVKDFFY